MLLGRGLLLEYATLGWNVVGVIVLAIAAIAAGSVALAGFGMDSLIEIVASAVVVWQLKGEEGSDRERRALRIIAIAFVLLAIYIAVQGAIILSSRTHPGHSTLGIVWLAITVLAMLALAAGKRETGRRLGNPVLQTESRVTLIDGALAAAVLAGVVLNAAAGWWWADRSQPWSSSSTACARRATLGSKRTDERRRLSTRTCEDECLPPLVCVDRFHTPVLPDGLRSAPGGTLEFTSARQPWPDKTGSSPGSVAPT
jgi:hypothetical protein